MQADDLRPGNVFLECSEDQWASMSNAERKRMHRVKVIARLGACTATDRTHIRTDRGDWCIPRVAPVMLAPAVRSKPHPRKPKHGRTPERLAA